MSSNEDAKKLAELLDRLCAGGSEHINVRGSGEASNDGFDIIEKTEKSTDCCEGDVACRIPTLHKGIDDKEE